MSLDFSKVYARWWNDEDLLIREELKRIKCAEALIPNCVPVLHILGAVVPCSATADRLLDAGFELEIIVNRDVFFLDGGF